MNGYVCPPLRLSHLFHYVRIIVSSWKELLPMTKVRSLQKVKVRGQRSRSQRSKPNLTVSGPLLQFEFTYDDKMMHKTWSSIEEVPYCFSRLSIKFQGNMGQKKSTLTQIGRFRTVTLVRIHWWLWNHAQSLKQHRRGCPIVFQCPTSNFKVTRDNKSPILTRIERFRTAT